MFFKKIRKNVKILKNHWVELIKILFYGLSDEYVISLCSYKFLNALSNEHCLTISSVYPSSTLEA